MKNKNIISLRHACFSALLEYEKKATRIDRSLKKWQDTENPKDLNYKLAQEISFGVVKRKLTLDYFIDQIENINKLKIREKTILRIALYQMHFMDKIPFYAIVNESVALAKKVISKKTGAFFNVLLRKLDGRVFKSPSDKELHILYSYPKYFIDLLLHQFDVEQTENLLRIMNIPPVTFVKGRNVTNKLKKTDAEDIYENGFILYKLKNLSLINKLKNDPDYYFQSLTQAKLVDCLALKTKDITSVMDLCAAPGGKLISAADLYPTATLYANDISNARLKTLKENIGKYKLDVELFCEPAENFVSNEHFDLVIVDAPCSNSGVLNRRAEARWAITKDHLHDLLLLQKAILKKAVSLMQDNGSIWYLTCSILIDENENQIQDVCEKYGLRVSGKMHKILPDENGYDGGFGCVLKKL